jgi:4-hydroxyphenylacetate 3-monooxygenase
MPARTGTEFRDALNGSRRDVQVHGERVRERIGEHPALRGLVESYACLFDLQHEPDLRDVLTYESPTTGNRVSTSFLEPRTQEDLVRRRAMMKAWADWSLGTLGRTGDYLNSALMAMAAAADWFGQKDAAYAENVRRYCEHVRENDLLLTHTLINPQSNRSVSAASQADPFLAARIVEETGEGIVIRGARMLATLGPIADEIMVFPSTVLRDTPEDEPYANAFAIPCDTPGLRFLCRESFDYGRGHFDHPLASRFEEIDAVVIFDDVLVPWERCFMVRSPELLHGGRLYYETNAIVHMTHQVVTRTTAKTEALLGLVDRMVDAIQIGQFQHVQEKTADVIMTLEILRALTRASEADAAIDRFGVMTPAWAPLNAARNWFPRTYPRLRDVVWQLGASGIFGVPTEGDVLGEAHEDVERFLQCASLGGAERVRLFRLAWDWALSAFAGRQEAYEFFFFGDPVRMAGAYAGSYDRAPYAARIEDFLHRDAAVAGPATASTASA